MAIGSFHLVRHHGTLAAMSQLGPGRVLLRRTHGLRFWRVLGTGAGRNTGPGADLRRTALFAMWDDEAALDRFQSRAWPRAVEAWHVRLRAAGGHGAWRGHAVLAEIEQATDTHGPVAIITRADVKRHSWRAFNAAGPAVSDELNASPGLLAVVGIGEAPVGRLGTFSLWDSYAAARRFAYTQPHHRQAITATRDGGWYGEELFARFQPFASSGTWDGIDPLG